MKIAIEAQRIFRKEKHGMDYVALETIREIQKIDRQNEYFILVSPGEDRCLQESDNMHIVQIDYPSYPLWEQIGLPSTLKKIQPDLLHCTGNTAPLWCHTPLILTLHDIIFLEPKQGKNQSVYQKLGRCYRRFVVPRILNKCRKIITVSNFEREHICKFLHWEPKKITTVYNGYSSHFRPITEYQAVTQKYIGTEHYFFFLGNTDPKKNTARILQAYRHYLNTSSQPLPLLIADLKEEVINNYLRTYGLTDIKSMLYYPGYIPNKDLPALYSGATAFVTRKFRYPYLGSYGMWYTCYHLTNLCYARNCRKGCYLGKSLQSRRNSSGYGTAGRRPRIPSFTVTIWFEKGTAVFLEKNCA